MRSQPWNLADFLYMCVMGAAALLHARSSWTHDQGGNNSNTHFNVSNHNMALGQTEAPQKTGHTALRMHCVLMHVQT